MMALQKLGGFLAFAQAVLSQPGMSKSGDWPASMGGNWRASMTGDWTTPTSGDRTTTAAAAANDATASSGTVVSSGTTSAYRELFTIPASADVGANLLPNIDDPVSSWFQCCE